LLLQAAQPAKNPLRKQVKLLQKGIIKDDTSFVYSLPYEKGRSYLIVQDILVFFSPAKSGAGF
jgi:hypothetical protein